MPPRSIPQPSGNGHTAARSPSPGEGRGGNPSLPPWVGEGPSEEDFDHECPGPRDGAPAAPQGEPANPMDTRREEYTDVNDPSSYRVSGPSGKVERFPVEVFPGAIRRFIDSVASALPCPPDYPGVMMLPVLSSFIGLKASIQLKPSWIEYAILWAGLIADSGERKTPAFNATMEPLRQKQRELYRGYLVEKQAYQALSGEDKKDVPCPSLKQLFTTTATIESINDVLKANPNGVLFAADELSGWKRAMGQYKTGKGDDSQQWLSIWSAQPIICNRKNLPEPIVIDKPFVSVMGGIQPDALGDLIDEARADGGPARILFSYPDPIPPSDWTEEGFEGGAEYHALCDWLFDLKTFPRPLTLTTPAKAKWAEFINAHRKETPPRSLRPFWSKCEGYCARLALVLFLSRVGCRETKGGWVDEPSISGAAALIRYFKSHARRAYGCVAERSDNTRIGQALRWVRLQVARGVKVTVQRVQNHGVCNVKSAAEAHRLLDALESEGYGTLSHEPRGSFVFHLADPTDPIHDGPDES